MSEKAENVVRDLKFPFPKKPRMIGFEESQRVTQPLRDMLGTPETVTQRVVAD